MVGRVFLDSGELVCLYLDHRNTPSPARTLRPTTTDEGQPGPTKRFLARGEPDRSLFGQTMHVIVEEQW